MFPYPHCYTPTVEAQQAAQELLARVHIYMEQHPESELHKRGKMFGILICDSDILSAFSGMLDGSYYHDGFVAPIYSIKPEDVIGTDRADSQRKQRWLFEQYHLLNARGETKTVLDCFVDEATFGSYPPAGTGECCAPKLLQAAYQRGMTPLSMAEIWIGASPADEVRVEGQFYPACISKCRPLLRHMLSGLLVEENPLLTLGRKVAEKTSILYEDEWLIVVDKPSGLLSVPGRDGQYSLLEYLTDRAGNTGSANFLSVHRLDMDTSGVMVLAKMPEIQRELQRQFFAHEVEKTYLAEVSATDASKTSSTSVTSNPSSTSNSSNPSNSSETDKTIPYSGTISLPLAPNPLDRPRQVVDYEHGKRAVTHYQFLSPSPMERVGERSLLLLTPETGRTHQLRVHCAVGLKKPILGDRLYGDGVGPLHLHAHTLSFTHPHTGDCLTFSSYPDW